MIDRKSNKEMAQKALRDLQAYAAQDSASLNVIRVLITEVGLALNEVREVKRQRKEGSRATRPAA